MIGHCDLWLRRTVVEVHGGDGVSLVRDISSEVWRLIFIAVPLWVIDRRSYGQQDIFCYLDARRGLAWDAMSGPFIDPGSNLFPQ